MGKIRLRKSDRKKVAPAGTNKAIYVRGKSKRADKTFRSGTVSEGKNRI